MSWHKRLRHQDQSVQHPGECVCNRRDRPTSLMTGPQSRTKSGSRTHFWNSISVETKPMHVAGATEIAPARHMFCAGKSKYLVL